MPVSTSEPSKLGVNSHCVGNPRGHLLMRVMRMSDTLRLYPPGCGFNSFCLLKVPFLSFCSFLVAYFSFVCSRTLKMKSNVRPRV